MKSATILIRRERDLFHAWAGDHEAWASSATCAARAAAAKAFGVQASRIEVTVVDHGELGRARQVLQAVVRTPSTPVARDLLWWALGTAVTAAVVAWAMGGAR